MLKSFIRVLKLWLTRKPGCSSLQKPQNNPMSVNCSTISNWFTILYSAQTVHNMHEGGGVDAEFHLETSSVSLYTRLSIKPPNHTITHELSQENDTAREGKRLCFQRQFGWLWKHGGLPSAWHKTNIFIHQ